MKKHTKAHILVTIIVAAMLLAMVTIALFPVAAIAFGIIYHYWVAVFAGGVMAILIIHRGFEPHCELAELLRNQISRHYRLLFFHIVELPTETRIPEITTWCNENLSGKHGEVTVSLLIPEDSRKFWFSLEKDAIAFKMRWV